MSSEDVDDSSLTAEQYLGKVTSVNLLQIFFCFKNCNLEPQVILGVPKKSRMLGGA